MNNRTDRLTAVYIDLALNLVESHGVAAGARALFDLGLPLELARRVLLQPGQRRDYFAFTARQASNRSTTHRSSAKVAEGAWRRRESLQYPQAPGLVLIRKL